MTDYFNRQVLWPPTYYRGYRKGSGQTWRRARIYPFRTRNGGCADIIPQRPSHSSRGDRYRGEKNV